jgi:hypothetical protein
MTRDLSLAPPPPRKRFQAPLFGNPCMIALLLIPCPPPRGKKQGVRNSRQEREREGERECSQEFNLLRPCLLPAPKPNDSQIPFASSMMNNCSHCPSWTAVARAAAGRLTTISASVAAAHTLARGHTALLLAVRKVHAQRTRTACALLASATWRCSRAHTRLHLVACGCIVLPTTVCVCGPRNGYAGHAA